MRHPLMGTAAVLLCAFVSTGAVAETARAAIEHAVANPDRSADARARDRYRHPVETLSFFEVQPGQRVVEFLPGGGWYTNILGPLLRDRGQYVALVPEGSQAQKTTEMLLAAHRSYYGAPQIATIRFADGAVSLPENSVDRLLTFRNVHNLLPLGQESLRATFAAFYRVLKPGGILGVSDHRLPEDRDPKLEYSSGYVKTSTVIRLAREAGFELVASSEINANPKDSANWPDGVWTLPPVLKLGARDRAHYVAIGESDRMTLKFVKPIRGDDSRRVQTTLASGGH